MTHDGGDLSAMDQNAIKETGNYGEKESFTDNVEAAIDDPKASPPMTFKRFMVLLSLVWLLVTSATPILFITAVLSYVVADIGGAQSEAWLGTASTVATAAIAPFAGAISDLIGRRYVALLGSALIIIGMIIVGTAHRMDVAIGGTAIVGVGGGLAELVGFAGIQELAPVKSRGKYMGTAFLFNLPFGAAQAYAQLYTSSSTWRWGAWISVILCAVNFVMLWIFYRPPPRANSLGLTKREIVARIDFVGGLLSIGGFSIFLLGLQWGGVSYPWRSAHVIVTITLGLVLLIAFCIWEMRAPYPMFPRALFTNKVATLESVADLQRISVLTLIITALAGANYWSLAAFWPLECQTLYGPDAMKVALYVLPFLYSITFGMILVNWGLSLFRGKNRELLTFSSVIMTVGIACLALVNQHNPSVGIGLSFLAGLGTGGILQPAVTVLTTVCPDEVIATITAATVSIRLVGSSIGFAVYFNVLQNKLTPILPVNVGTAVAEAGLPPDQIPTFLGAFLGQTGSLAGYAPAVLIAATNALKDSYVEGFRMVYFVSIAFGASAIIACLFLGDIKKFMVDRVAVDIH